MLILINTNCAKQIIIIIMVVSYFIIFPLHIYVISQMEQSPIFLPFLCLVIFIYIPIFSRPIVSDHLSFQSFLIPPVPLPPARMT